MKFVKTDDLVPGMRLAKPIYNRNGVLLYDRNSALSAPGINSVKNFGLIGVYILEPAEPLPPMTREDLDFEQHQTIYMFQLRECLDLILKRKPLDPLPSLVEDILAHYGELDHRVNFNQNLRSSEDFMYKHAISTAILAAMLSNRLGFEREEQMSLVTAALLYDIGYRYVPHTILEKGTDLEQGDKDLIQQSLEKGLNLLGTYQHDFDFFPQAYALMTTYIFSSNPQKAIKPDGHLSLMFRLLKVADCFDQMTAMNLGHAPESEIMAMLHMKRNPKDYSIQIVNLLAECIHIVPQAANIDLSTGDKGIVLVENPKDYLHPVILRLSDNTIYDLSNPDDASRIQIRDIMKTMDNRIHIDEEALKHFVPDERLKALTQKFLEKLALSKKQA